MAKDNGAAGVKKGDHVYLVDGSTYIFRAYHALPPLTRKSDGLPVGAVSGFCNMLYKLLCDARDGDQPTHFAVIFDHSGKTFRNEIYPEYKANRPPAPEDLVPQFPLVRDAARAFSAAAIEMKGYEADDLIATYATLAAKVGATVTIISSDKDLMQLVGDGVEMYDTMKNRRIGEEEVFEKFGVAPEKVIDVQSLAGDSVDNVPGAPGIGVKTAAQLINDYGDLDELLSRAEEIKQPKRRQTLIDFADQIRISRDLVTLKTDVPVETPLGELTVRPIEAKTLLPFIDEMGFKTIRRRVLSELEGEESETPAGDSPAIDAHNYETVSTKERLEAWVAVARERGVVAVDTETNSLDAMQADLVGVSLCVDAGAACYVPLAHKSDELELGGADAGQIPLKEALKVLKPLLEDASILKIGQNIKYDAQILSRHGVEIHPIDDTMLISFVLDAGVHGHGMDELSTLFLDHQPIKFSEVVGTGKNQKTFDQVPIPEATKYAAEDADITRRLHAALKPRLASEGKSTVYETLERPLSPILRAMEHEGVKVDRQKLSRLSGEFAQRMAKHEAEAHELAGEPFNLGSPKQVSEILFGKLGLPGGKKTAKGAWSTKADILESLAAEGHDLPRALLNWRQLSKLKSTYTDALPLAINPETGRIHTSYAQTGAATGRLASTDPNLQNIPIRTDDGRKIRTAFVAEKGNVLISADYSQIELRLLAHVAGLDALKSAFRQGLDIHAMTASEMFGEPIEGMDPMVRRRAKAINFGIIYGISAFGLSNQLQIPRGEAKAYIDSYFEKFPGIRDYMEDMKAFAKEHGYVETIFGRRCYLKGIADKNPARRSFAERQAINAPLQGAAADIIKRAMIRIPDALRKAKLNAKMLLQVHDELIFEAPSGEADTVCDLVRDVMEAACAPALSLDVPLVVEAASGAHWGEAH